MQIDTKKLLQGLGTLLLGVIVGVTGSDVIRPDAGDVVGPREGLYAVFLDNGQVYFGNISKQSNETVWLSGIYYLQKGETDPSKTADAALLKLGNELHGPEDWMEINREHVLFIEKLKGDGKVSQAIDAYRQK